MGLISRAVALVAVGLGLVTATAPASLFDEAVSQASEGRVRLTDPAGTIWSGRGILANDHGERSLSPWAVLSWQFEPAGLLRGAMAWDLALGERPAARLEVGMSGVRFKGVDLNVPVRPLLASMPATVFQLGWHGRLGAKGDVIACSWQQRCIGRLDATWMAAATDILPGVPLGDYRGELVASGDDSVLVVSSAKDNALRVEGRLVISASKAAGFDLLVGGDPAIVDRLPAMLHGHAQRVGDGRLRVRS